MKKIVFVPVGIRVLMPRSNRSILFACALSHLAPLLPQRRVPISSIFSVDGLRAEPVKRVFYDLALWTEVMGALLRYFTANTYLIDCCDCSTGWELGRCMGGWMHIGGCCVFGWMLIIFVATYACSSLS